VGHHQYLQPFIGFETTHRARYSEGSERGKRSGGVDGWKTTRKGEGERCENCTPSKDMVGVLRDAFESNIYANMPLVTKKGDRPENTPTVNGV